MHLSQVAYFMADVAPRLFGWHQSNLIVRNPSSTIS
jgi:hypothetical protein